MRWQWVRYAVLDTEPLRVRAFRWLIFGQVGAQLARQSLIVVVSYDVFVRTHSSFLVGAIGAIQVAPVIVFSLVGGVLADLRDRRSILMATQAVITLSTLGLALNTRSDQLWPIYVLATINAAASAVESPARTSLIPELVAIRLLPSAFAVNQSLNRTLQVVGPALGGAVMAAAGVGPAYLLGVVSAALAIAAIRPIGRQHRAAGSHESGLRALGEGWRFVRGAPLIRQTLVVDFNAMVFGMPRALFPVIGTTTLGGGAATVGLLYAAPGAGAMVAALTMGWVHAIRRQGRLVLLSVIVWGLAIAAFGFCPVTAVSLALLAIAGAADVVSNVFRQTILQASVPDGLRGRVTAFKNSLSTTGPMLGDAESGTVASVTTPTFAVVSGGLMSIVGAVGVCVVGRSLWRQEAVVDDEPAAGRRSETL